MQQAFKCDILKSNVRVCCAVYLLIPNISATSSTMRRHSQSMSSCAVVTVLQFLNFDRPCEIFSVLPWINLPFQLYACALETFL